MYSPTHGRYTPKHLTIKKSNIMLCLLALVPVIIVAGAICGFANGRDETVTPAVVTSEPMDDCTVALLSSGDNQTSDVGIVTSTLALKTENVTIVEPDDDIWGPDNNDIILLAKVMCREARGCSVVEQSAVAWCVLNRVDSSDPYYPDTIEGVVTQPNQFAYYEDTPVTDHFVALATDVLIRWHYEDDLPANIVGRTLPKTYLFFVGDGTHNYFTENWCGSDFWDWSYDDPYTDGVYLTK